MSNDCKTKAEATKHRFCLLILHYKFRTLFSSTQIKTSSQLQNSYSLSGVLQRSSFFSFGSFLRRASSFDASLLPLPVTHAQATETTSLARVYFAPFPLFFVCSENRLSRSVVIPLYNELSLHLIIYT